MPSSGALYLLAHKCFTAGPRIAETCGKIAKKRYFSSFFYSPMCPSTIISTELDFLIAKDTSLYIWKMCGFNYGLLWAVMGSTGRHLAVLDVTNVAERAEGAERADRADVAKMGNLAYMVFILKVYILKFMLFEVLSCISHVKVYIVAEVYCLYCRPCPAQTDPCQMDRDTQIIQRSLCFIFHLFFLIIFCMCLSIFICQIFVFCFVPARWTNTQNICTLYKDLFVFYRVLSPRFSAP